MVSRFTAQIIQYPTRSNVCANWFTQQKPHSTSLFTHLGRQGDGIPPNDLYVQDLHHLFFVFPYLFVYISNFQEPISFYQSIYSKLKIHIPFSPTSEVSKFTTGCTAIEGANGHRPFWNYCQERPTELYPTHFHGQGVQQRHLTSVASFWSPQMVMVGKSLHILRINNNAVQN